MQVDNPKAAKLYTNLINDGYTSKNLGSIDEFSAALNDPVKADKIYNGLISDGYTPDNLGSQKEFMQTFTQAPEGFSAKINQGEPQKPLPFNQEQPEPEQQTIENNFGLNHDQIALNQQSVSDNTTNVAPKEALQGEYNEAHIPEFNQQKADYKEKVLKATPDAITNAAKKSLQIKGIDPNNAALLNKEKQNFQDQISSGNAAVSFDKDGNPGLVQTPGLFGSLWDHLKTGVTNLKDARDFKNMTDQERVDYANKHPQTPYIGVKPTQAGSVGALIGDIAPTMGRYAAGAAVGGALSTLAPETGGLSTLALKPVMSFALNEGADANISGMNGTLQRFYALRQKNPQGDQVEQMKEARNGEDVDRMAGVATAGLFSMVGNGELGSSVTGNILKKIASVPVKDAETTAASGISKLASNAINSGLSLGEKTSVVEGAKDIGHNLEGVTDKNASNIASDMAQAFAENAPLGTLLDAGIGVLSGVVKAPPIIKSAIKYDLLTKIKPEVFQQALQKGLDGGALTPDQYQKTISSLQEFDNVLKTVPDYLSDESKSSVAGLILKRKSLEQQNETLDPTARKLNQPEIDGINNQINEIYRTGKPLENEINPATGKTFEPPTYDDVAQQQVKDLAQNIAKGRKIEKPEDIQTQANFPDQLKTELQKLSDEEKSADVVGEKPKTVVQDNIKNYLVSRETKDEVNSISNSESNNSEQNNIENPKPTSSPIISDREEPINKAISSVEETAKELNDKYFEDKRIGKQKQLELIDLIPKEQVDNPNTNGFYRVSKMDENWVSKQPKEAQENIKKLNDIFKEKNREDVISEAYHKAKQDGSNPELVKAVEDLLTPKEPTPTEEQPSSKPTNTEENTSKESSPVISKGVENKWNIGDTVPADPPYFKGGKIKSVIKETDTNLKVELENGTKVIIPKDKSKLMDNDVQEIKGKNNDNQETTLKSILDKHEENENDTDMDLVQSVENHLKDNPNPELDKAIHDYWQAYKESKEVYGDRMGLTDDAFENFQKVLDQEIGNEKNKAESKRLNEFKPNEYAKNTIGGDVVKILGVDGDKVTVIDHLNPSGESPKNPKEHILDAKKIPDYIPFKNSTEENNSVKEAFEKVKELKDIPSDVSEAFRNKYDSENKLTPEKAFEKFYNEVKDKEPKVENGKEIEPHKEVKANKNIAIKDVLPKYPDLKEMEAGMLHQLGKNGEVDAETLEDKKGLKGVAYSKLYDNGYLEIPDDFSNNNYVVSEKGKKFIDNVDARLDTRKSVKAGTDLFPEEANIPEFKLNKSQIRIAKEKIPKKVADRAVKEGITLDNIDDFKHLFNEAGLTPEDFKNVKEDLNGHITEPTATGQQGAGNGKTDESGTEIQKDKITETKNPSPEKAGDLQPEAEKNIGKTAFARSNSYSAYRELHPSESVEDYNKLRSSDVEIPTKDLRELSKKYVKEQQANFYKAGLTVPLVDKFFEHDVTPRVEKIGGTFKDAIRGIINALSPKTGVSEKAVTNLMRALGERNAAAAAVDKALSGLEKVFDKMKDEDRISFIDKMKRGEKQLTPQLQDVADALKSLDKDLYDEIASYKPSLTWKENHFRVLWKVIPGSEKSKFWSNLTRRPLQGSKGFFKMATLSDMSEGIEKGGVPQTTNPIRMFKLSYADGMKYVTAQRMFEALKKDKMIQFVKTGDRAPDFFVPIDDNIAKVYFKSDAGLVKAGEYYIEEGAGRLLNNHLSRDKAREHSVGKGLMEIKNLYTQVELGLSGFHAIAEGLETVSSDLGLGLRKLINLGTRGDFKMAGEGIMDILKSPFSPKTTFTTGRNAIKFATEKEFENSDFGKAWLKRMPDAQQYITDFFNGGGLLKQSEDLRATTFESLKEQAGKDNYIGAALRALPAMNEAILSPLFNHYIPALKVGMFFKEFPVALKENEARLTKGDVTRDELARKTVNFIDDRLGEMNFDNLFWNRTFKTAMQFMMRSVTWKLGNLRAMLGSVPEQGQEFINAAKEKRAPLLMPKMAWLFGLSAMQVGLSTVIMKMLANKTPQSFKDIVAPQINPDDEKDRVIMPTYYKDMLHLWHSKLGYVTTSMSGPFSKMADIWQNKDFYNYEIHDEHDNFFQKRKDDLLYFIPKPFSISSSIQQIENGDGGKAVMSFFGLNKAPGYLTNSDIENEIFDLYNIRNTSVKPKSEKEANDIKKQIRELYKDDKKQEAQSMADDAVKKGLLRPTQIKYLFSHVGKEGSPAQFFFKELPYEDKKYLVGKMTDEEKKIYDPKGKFKNNQ